MGDQTILDAWSKMSADEVLAVLGDLARDVRAREAEVEMPQYIILPLDSPLIPQWARDEFAREHAAERRAIRARKRAKARRRYRQAHGLRR